MGTLDDLIRDLRTFEAKKEVIRQLRTEFRKPVPVVRSAIKQRALDTLPKSGGLNVWVSRTRITAQIRISGSRASVRLRGGRRSVGGTSDINRIDKGRTRHPSWGRRGAGQWHAQAVEPGFFTKPNEETDAWREAILSAVDNALDLIRRG